VHPKGEDSMAISGLSLNTPWLALGGPLLSSYEEEVEKTVLSPCTAPISGGEAFFPVSSLVRDY